MEESKLEAIFKDTQQALKELLEAAAMKPGQIVVVGCSTSEVVGKKIGSSPNLEVAQTIFQALYTLLQERGIFLAVQCCEHLNRALVVERECMERYNLEEVTVVPHPKAGGALATVAYYSFKDPVVVESLQAHAGMDIGDTFIGMHLKRVAVPVRGSVKSIGEAHLTMARTRPKLIGGERARYARDPEWQKGR
ncbi:MAG TPA: TIGR01440 family protein [Moorella mulderi]|nr:TIGR01440 family protein [Moorella mulderi]